MSPGRRDLAHGVAQLAAGVQQRELALVGDRGQQRLDERVLLGVDAVALLRAVQALRAPGDRRLDDRLGVRDLGGLARGDPGRVDDRHATLAEVAQVALVGVPQQDVGRVVQRDARRGRSTHARNSSGRSK
jgi:hypothetical protein